jgi:hypothetical protein
MIFLYTLGMDCSRARIALNALAVGLPLDFTGWRRVGWVIERERERERERESAENKRGSDRQRDEISGTCFEAIR